MDIKIRRIVYLSFIALFLMVAPLLVMYASGFRYNFKRESIEQLGILLVRAHPKNSNVFINGEYRSKELFASGYVRIPNLRPTHYLVEVNKEGHFPWSKWLNVYGNTTTFAENIFLFKNSPPSLIRESGENLKIFYSGNNQLGIFLEKDKKHLTLFQAPKNEFRSIDASTLGVEEVLNMVFSHDNSRVAIIYERNGQKDDVKIADKELSVLNIKENKFSDPIRLLPTDSEQKNHDYTIKWDGNNYFFLLINENLYRFNLTKNSLPLYLADKKIYSFEIKDHLYLISEEEGVKYFSVFNRSSEKYEKFSSLPEGDYSIASNYDKYFFLVKDDAEIIVYDIQQKTIIADIYILGDEMKWKNDFSKFLYHNDFEIGVYPLDDKKDYFLTRLSRPIEGVEWITNDYIAVYHHDSIKIIELDDRDKRNQAVYDNLAKIQNAVFDHENFNFYFTASINDEPGIYQLDVFNKKDLP